MSLIVVFLFILTFHWMIRSNIGIHVHYITSITCHYIALHYILVSHVVVRLTLLFSVKFHDGDVFLVPAPPCLVHSGRSTDSRVQEPNTSDSYGLGQVWLKNSNERWDTIGERTLSCATNKMAMSGHDILALII